MNLNSRKLGTEIVTNEMTFFFCAIFWGQGSEIGWRGADIVLGIYIKFKGNNLDWFGFGINYFELDLRGTFYFFADKVSK